MIELEPREQDDPEHLAQLLELVRGAAAQYGAEDVYVVQIDNWFGSNWLGFSHKHVGQVGLHYTVPGFVLPPFVPARVRSERRFSRDARGEHQPAPHEHPLHVAQMGSMNRYRGASKERGDAVLFWYAARSKETARGALMCYYPTPDGHDGWYVGFARRDGWQVAETERLAPRTLEAFLHAGRAAAAPKRS